MASPRGHHQDLLQSVQATSHESHHEGVAAKPLAATMKGKIASRAHSFKENLLEALGHHGHHHSHHTHHQHAHPSGNGSLNRSIDSAKVASTSNGAAAAQSSSNGRPTIHLAKKTSSTDNLIGYTEPKQSTDALVRDVQLSLRYFEDAVSKGTYELLPGCASIVLERVVAIQAFAFHDRPGLKDDVRAAQSLDKLYEAVSALVRWADAVIVTGAVKSGLEGSDDFSESIVEPVRKSVIVLVNRLAQLSISGGGDSLAQSKSSGLHNSLPDISSSQQDIMGGAGAEEEVPPRLPKRHHHRHHHHHHRHHHDGTRCRHRKHQHQQHQQDAPPLPPKLAKQPSVTLVDPTMYGQADWFANPLFEGSNSKPASGRGRGGTSLYETSFIGDVRPPPPPSSSSSSPPSHHEDKPRRQRILAKSFTIDATDATNTGAGDRYNFPYMDEATSPVEQTGKMFFGEERPDVPPVLPKKEVRRKRSQYDNLWEGPQQQQQQQQQQQSSNLGNNASSTPSYLTSSQSFDLGRGGRGSPASTSAAANNRSHLLDDDRRMSDGGVGEPPPLPPKKRDIINYMEILGQSLLPTREDLMQSLAQTQLLLRNVWADNYHQFGEFIPVDNTAFNHFPATPDLFTRNMDLSMLEQDHQFLKLPDFFDELSSSVLRPPNHNLNDNLVAAHAQLNLTYDSNVPPALPPKKNRPNLDQGGKRRQHQQSSSRSNSRKERIIPIVRETDGSVVSPAGPNQNMLRQHQRQQQQQQLRSTSSLTKRLSTESAGTSNSSVYSVTTDADTSHSRPNSIASSGQEDVPNVRGHPMSPISVPSPSPPPPPPPLIALSEKLSESPTPSAAMFSEDAAIKPTSPPPPPSSGVVDASSPPIVEDSALNRLTGEEKQSTLIYASNSEGILELRAGDLDELIVLATQTTNRDFVYQDAFLLTYRTFISTMRLLESLQHRFRRFNNKDDALQLRAARSAFSLMVRVVDSLIDCDLNSPSVSANLSSFISELVQRGDLLLARALRTKFIQRYEEHRAKNLPDLLVDFGRLAVLRDRNRPPQSILHFKSSELAEQITLMDHQLFLRLEPGELLLWVKEQNEEKSPNLVKFTEHFNAVSYWCRTCLLTETDPKEREKMANKFIKVMKCLRKHNNFNSYLAFLSALDSASIRRLDWPKSFTDVIKDFSAIIDFSGSFKAYREALAHATPPLIPYMGLVLQDLTFVHIGNSDNVKGGKVNFAKRWQQYNILDNVRRFKRAQYSFCRRDDIARCFGNFEHTLSENKLWELSETIKPRASASASTDHLLDTGHQMPATRT